MENKQFAILDMYFRKACELAKVKNTPRQASKYRNGKGSAILHKKMAIVMVNNATKV